MTNELDKKILKAIREGKTKFSSISMSINYPGPHGYRAVDRRLQALRKSGAIKYDRKNGWSLVSEIAFG